VTERRFAGRFGSSDGGRETELCLLLQTSSNSSTSTPAQPCVSRYPGFANRNSQESPYRFHFGFGTRDAAAGTRRSKGSRRQTLDLRPRLPWLWPSFSRARPFPTGPWFSYPIQLPKLSPDVKQLPADCLVVRLSTHMSILSAAVSLGIVAR
jgi:hypothetical protein